MTALDVSLRALVEEANRVRRAHNVHGPGAALAALRRLQDQSAGLERVLAGAKALYWAGRDER